MHGFHIYFCFANEVQSYFANFGHQQALLGQPCLFCSEQIEIIEKADSSTAFEERNVRERPGPGKDQERPLQISPDVVMMAPHFEWSDMFASLHLIRELNCGRVKECKHVQLRARRKIRDLSKQQPFY